MSRASSSVCLQTTTLSSFTSISLLNTIQALSFHLSHRRFSLFQSIKMADRVHRITMLKLPNPADQQKLIEAYKTVDATNQKDGKPYILSLVVGVAEEDPRAQGYTVVCKTEFASMDDMKYYDESCAAHKNLKATALELGVEGIMTAYFKPQLIGRSA